MKFTNNQTVLAVSIFGGMPREVRLAGGGFQWAQDASLYRGEELIAASWASDLTWEGSRQVPSLAADNARLALAARPGDRLVIRRGAGDEREYIVASPMGRRRAMRPESHQEGARDSLRVRLALYKRDKRARHAAARAKLKEEARSHRMGQFAAT